ncbi:MAG: LacI family DNA-binding transcriptional regulator [Bryobacteraceae bacterium]
MKDIARDLNVSVVTVSKVLRNHSDISPETTERVLQRIRELNYRPNVAARSLVTGRSFILGLVVPDLTHPFFGEIAKAITSVSRPRGYSLVIASAEDDPDLELAEVEALLARQVDAIILASSQTSAQATLFQRLEERRTPIVLMDRALSGVKADFVGVDDEQVGWMATNHLIERGCRRIAHIRGPEISPGIGRFLGYRKALAQHQIEVPLHYVVKTPSADDRGSESGYDAMRELLASQTPPDGVFCFNDELAIGALRAIFEANLRVPEDIAVIGVGNMRQTDLLRVPLTTIDQSSAKMGEQAALSALKIIESKSAIAPTSILVPVRLIERASTAR